MTGLDRFMTALNREQPDRVPTWELIINEPTLSAFHGPVDPFEFAEREDMDGVCVFETMQFTPVESTGLHVDDWGINWRWEIAAGGYPSGGPIKTHEDLQSYEPA